MVTLWDHKLRLMKLFLAQNKGKRRRYRHFSSTFSKKFFRKCHFSMFLICCHPFFDVRHLYQDIQDMPTFTKKKSNFKFQFFIFLLICVYGWMNTNLTPVCYIWYCSQNIVHLPKILFNNFQVNSLFIM